MKSFPLVVLAFVVWTGSVRGDAAPPFLRELDSRGITSVRFDNLTEYPNFTFYLTYQQRISGAPSNHEDRVQSGEVIEKDRLWGPMYLLAVPNGHASAPSSKPIREPSPNCLKSERLEGTDTGYLVPYRVRIENDKLEVIMQRREWLPGQWSLWWLKRLLCFFVPIAFSATVAWLGARFARRRVSAKPARPSL